MQLINWLRKNHIIFYKFGFFIFVVLWFILCICAILAQSPITALPFMVAALVSSLTAFCLSIMWNIARLGGAMVETMENLADKTTKICDELTELADAYRRLEKRNGKGNIYD